VVPAAAVMRVVWWVWWFCTGKPPGDFLIITSSPADIG
jgi:hypothetical protein